MADIITTLLKFESDYIVQNVLFSIFSISCAITQYFGRKLKATKIHYISVCNEQCCSKGSI